MKLAARPKPEYVKKPMHTSTRPNKSTRVSGSADLPIKIFSVKAMFVTGSDKACKKCTDCIKINAQQYER